MWEIILIYTAGALGILGHWATRYVQARTQNSLIDYLKGNIVYTFASLSASFASSTAITMAITPDMTIQQILILIGTAYTAGYAGDSKFNRDKQPEPTIIEVKTHQADDLNDLLNKHHQS